MYDYIPSVWLQIKVIPAVTFEIISIASRSVAPFLAVAMSGEEALSVKHTIEGAILSNGSLIVSSNFVASLLA